jgi:hypothetical protein
MGYNLVKGNKESAFDLIIFSNSLNKLERTSIEND